MTAVSINSTSSASKSLHKRSHGAPDKRHTVHSAVSIEGGVTTPAWPVRDESITFCDVQLESGQRIDRVTVRYRLEGALAPARDNLVLVVHALTGTPHASEWWKGVIGSGEALDPTRHAILCANVLGGCAGTSGPRDGSDSTFPPFTTRDQATLLARLLDALGVVQPLLVCGGSLGGMVTLEFAAAYPERIRQAVVLAAPAAQTSQGLAWNAIMRRAVVIGGATEGLALARMVGMLSYRTPESLEQRFGRARNANGAFRVNDWLHAHGDRLVERFDASSYVALIDAMDTHDVGRGRGGVTAALASLSGRIIGVGVPGDLLYTADSVREWCKAIGATYRDLPSQFGHDAFLLETARVSAIINEALSRVEHEIEGAVALAALTSTSAAGAADSSAVSAAASPAIANALLSTAAPTVAHAVRTNDARLRFQARTNIHSTNAQRPLRIALAGCGHVGGALLDLLGEHKLVGSQPVQVTHVLVRDAARPRPALAQAIARGLAPANARVTDANRLLDGDVDVLIEAIGGTTTAQTLVETALKRGVRVISANKALLAERGPALTALAKSYSTTLDFEGAVAAAVPVVRCLRTGAAGVGVTRITGILNGTTNVVLERVASGESLADAIAHAQRAGFAEADPTRDLSGEDAEDKLRVLAWLAFGVDPSSLHVVRRGIDAETAAWAAGAARAGDRVKLLASCAREGDTIVARVVPTRVTADDAWANVTGPANRLVIESSSAGALVFHGPGAGGRATAGALFADLCKSSQT